MGVRALVVAISLASAASGAPAHAAENEFLGLLRARDLTTFGFLRLDMRPAHAIHSPPGTWAIEAEFAHQNTWALSRGARDYLDSLPGRRTLGPDEVAEVIRRARTHKAAVHPLGAGGRPLRAAEPERGRVFLSTKRLDQVLQLDEQSLLVHAQAGLTGLDAGLRTYEQANVALEVVVEVVDRGNDSPVASEEDEEDHVNLLRTPEDYITVGTMP